MSNLRGGWNLLNLGSLFFYVNTVCPTIIYIYSFCLFFKIETRMFKYFFQAGADAVLGRTIWGILGLGAFGFQLKEVPPGQHIITTTRSHSSKMVNDCISAMKPDSVVRVGGAGNKVWTPLNFNAMIIGLIF